MSKKKETAEAVDTTATNAEDTATVTSQAEETGENIASEETKTEDGFCMYLGPSVGSLKHGQMFNCTKEDALNTALVKEVIKKYPIVQTLLISDKTLAEDRVKIKTPGNLLYVNYHKLSKALG